MNFKSILSLALLLLAIKTQAQNPYDASIKSAAKPANAEDTKSEFAKKFNYFPISNWQPGIKFIIPPDANKIGFDLGLAQYKAKGSFPVKLKQSDYEWKIFVFQGLEERKGKAYAIFESEGKKYEWYFMFGGIESLKDERYKSFTSINGLAYLNDVDKAKGELENKTLYVLNTKWMRPNERGTNVWTFNNFKYIPVKVSKVGVGSQDAPVRIVFSCDSCKESFIDVRLSGINSSSTASVFGDDFDAAFSFTDPRSIYPSIPDEIWAMITQEKVKIGMSKGECLLSWGIPKKLNTTTTEGVQTEQWVYTGNRYLYFRDDLLTTIQD